MRGTIVTEIVMSAPRARGLFVLTAHPEGCRVLAERQWARAQAGFEAPLAKAAGKTALILGSTTFGYGSSTAMALRAAGFERIIGVGYETPPSFRGEKLAMSSPGWYLTGALHAADPNWRTYFADAFAATTRDRVIADLKAQGEQVDLVVYNVAAPRRSHLGQEWNSSLLVMGDPLEVVGLDFKSGQLKPIAVEAAHEIQVEHTRRVMGGDDLEMWANALLYSGTAAEGMTVTALSYIGPKLAPVRRMYWEGALGAAKQHIDATTQALNERLESAVGGRAFTVMNPAVVTGASVAIPAMLRYISDYLGCDEAGQGIYDDPLDVGLHFAHSLYGDDEVWRSELDEEERLRLDQHELEPKLQEAIAALWEEQGEADPPEVTARGLARFRTEYAQLFGWEVEGVDYEAPCVPDSTLGEAEHVFDLIQSA